MPDILETIARGIHRADEMKGAPPWEEQSFFVKEAQLERARQGLEALREAAYIVLHAEVVQAHSHNMQWLSNQVLQEFRERGRGNG